MAKARPLVRGYLERISIKAFDQYRGLITDLVQRQHGVYALYKNDRLYYVGLAVNLRRRINQHLKDRHRGRWNRFSLYLVRKVDHIKEIESLLLRIADPAGNLQGGRLQRAANLKKDLRRMMEHQQQAELDDLLEGQSRAKRRSSGSRARRKKTAKCGAARPLKGVVAGKRIYASYKGKEYKAHVYRNGRIRFDGRFYDTPTGAAKAVVKRTVNGWSFWRVRRHGKLVPLRALKQ